MDKCEIIERLNKIAEHAVHTVGEEPFVMSLDDGIAVHEAIELLKKPEPEAVFEWKKEFKEYIESLDITRDEWKGIIEYIDELPSAQPEHKTGHWILDRSGAYCCDKCMEPCATYAMMKPRDKFCKMCGSRNEVMD